MIRKEIIKYSSPKGPQEELERSRATTPEMKTGSKTKPKVIFKGDE